MSEEIKSSTGTEIGSYHWFHTLVARQMHTGEFLFKHKHPDETILREWGKKLYDNSKELFAGYKHINSLQSENKRLREELDEAIRILKLLTELRDHKVINGKDDFYNNNRHLAWYDADMFLSKHKYL